MKRLNKGIILFIIYLLCTRISLLLLTKECHEKNPNCTFKCFDRLDCEHACERHCCKNDDPDHEVVVF